MNLVTVFNTFSPIEAQLICSRLDAAGVPATITHENAAFTVAAGPVSSGGVRVQVPEDRAAEARELIEAKSDDPIPAE